MNIKDHIDTCEENRINDILDKGIDEFRGNSLKSSMLNSNIEEKYNLNYNYTHLENNSKNPKSSALKNLLEEMKCDYKNRDKEISALSSNNHSYRSGSIADSADLNFNDMKYEINDLQSKIEGLEKRISKIK
jgi:gas vesicle protein